MPLIPSKINARDPQTLRYAISRACELKAQVVEKDEFERSGLRAVLNYGHTFGHALEAETGFSDRLLHGEGVALGRGQSGRVDALESNAETGSRIARLAPLALASSQARSLAGCINDGLVDDPCVDTDGDGENEAALFQKGVTVKKHRFLCQ
mgnify:CR=1 FL=1